jgi:S-(hydroxymethyl)glutathione dehydrogenase / alcohol dehydrogenase
MRFAASVLRAHGRPLEVESLSFGALAADQVLVRMHAAGVCHTDYEAWTGAYGVPLPTVLGHEGAGVVEALGADVRGVRAGDHVVCSAAPACGGCFYCRRTLPMLCETPPGALRTLKARDGSAVHPFLKVSSFAEYCVVPAQGAIPIPKEVPLESACLLGCAVITGVGAVQRIARVAQEESVAVVGCGAVGLNVLQGARMAGAAMILAIDTQPAKLERALQFGATHAWLASEGELVAKVKSLTSGRGVDHAFEAAGIVGSLQLALDLSRPGASVTILGKTQPEREIPLRFTSLLGERRIRRASLGGAQFAQDIPAYARAYLDGQLMLDEQIDGRVPLGRIGDAFSAIEQGRTIRTVVQLSGPQRSS